VVTRAGAKEGKEVLVWEKGTAEKKNGSESLLSHFFETVVRLAGIEPTTPWFVAKYSIQLSYSRPKHAL
jgi:hypothetical protein